MLDLVNEICPTKILLANPGADLAAYQRMFRLNEREGELFASLIPKRQFLVKTKEDYVCCPETIVAFAKGLNKAELHVLIELASRADAISRDGATASIRQLAV